MDLLKRALPLCAALAGCFSPDVADGQFACSPSDTRCPDGLACDPCSLLCVRAPRVSCDGGVLPDAGRDLSTALDLAGHDLTNVSDLSHAPDLSIAPDLTILPDLTIAPDLAILTDLAQSPPDAPPPDQAMPDLAMPDFATPDLAMPDLAMPDLAQPDLAVLDFATLDLAGPDLAMPDLTTCAPESDLAFCNSLNKHCGSATGTDNCGQARTVANCGTCGNNMTCTAGACGCTAGFLDCNMNLNDGCEVNSLTDANNCGGCGKKCSNNNIANPTCAAGLCNGTCNPGFADCNNNKLTDGCEVALGTTNNCSACGDKCINGERCYQNACCQPNTCNFGTDCGGPIDDGCGGTINCGGCNVDNICCNHTCIDQQIGC